MKKKYNIYIVVLLMGMSVIGLVSSQGLIDDSFTLVNLDDTLVLNPIDSQVLLYNSTSNLWYNDYLNNSGHSVNNTIYWDGNLYTDEGHWGINGNDIFYNDGDVSIGNSLDMTDGSVLNIFELVSTDGSRIAAGTNPAYFAFSGLDSAEVFSNNQTVGSGVITHALLSTDQGNEKVISAWQSGKNDSGQYTRNSMGVFPDLGLLDVSILTNIEQMWFNFGISPLADYFSAENRTAVAALYAFESQKLFLHDDLGQGELLGEGMFAWILRDGEKFNIREGAVHISDESIKEFGFPLGANITIFFEDFETVTLDKFTLITSGKGLDEWAVDASTIGDCPTVSESLICIHAGATGGSGDTIIQTNFTTINLGLNNLAFYINTDQMSSGGDFEVTMNNNVGSGDVSIYSTTINVLDQQIVTTIPASMDDQTQITMEIIFSSSHPIRGDVWIDHVIINATTTASSLQNISVQEGRIEFGNEECFISQSVIDEDLNQEINISCDNINLIGDVTAVSVTEVSINVTDSLDVGGNLTVVGNTTSTYYFGDGSQLTGIEAGQWDVSGNNLFPKSLNYDVGIGLNNPKNKLDIEGAMVIGSFYAGTNTAPSNGLLIYGNTGMGITNPDRKLEITSVATDLFGLKLSTTASWSTGQGTGIEFADLSGRTGHIKIDYDGISKTSMHFGGFYNSGYGSSSDQKMTIRGDGNVGIGTTAPQNKLDIEGAMVIGSSYAGVNTAPTDGLLVEGNIQGNANITLSNGGGLFVINSSCISVGFPGIDELVFCK